VNFYIFLPQKREKRKYYNSQDLEDAKCTQRNKRLFQLAVHPTNSMIILTEKSF